MLLHGKSIFLRAVEKTDATKLMLWENNPKHWKVTGTEVPYSMHAILDYIDQAQHIRQHGQLRLLICKNENQEPVGAIDLYNADFKHRRAAIGILIASDQDKGKGFASEAIELVMAYSKQVLDLQNIYCSIHSDNLASIHLFEKMGFDRVGVRKDWFWENGHWLDELLYQKCLRK